jgi:hypothetical protein
MDTKHTPLPWLTTKHGTPAYSPQFGVYAEGEPKDHCIVKGDSAEADSEFICRAVNSHYELLEALMVAEVHLGWGDCSLDNVHRMCREVIAKAKGTQQ